MGYITGLVARTPSTSRDLDLLVESFSFSFFEDLMNPENSEVELLKVIHKLIKLVSLQSALF